MVELISVKNVRSNAIVNSMMPTAVVTIDLFVVLVNDAVWDSVEKSLHELLPTVKMGQGLVTYQKYNVFQLLKVTKTFRIIPPATQ
jgi:hypothetical protein